MIDPGGYLPLKSSPTYTTFLPSSDSKLYFWAIVSLDNFDVVVVVVVVVDDDMSRVLCVFCETVTGTVSIPSTLMLEGEDGVSTVDEILSRPDKIISWGLGESKIGTLVLLLLLVIEGEGV